ncbi:MAG: dihydrolipoyl dehydrogenase family protein, partial [Actinomycetota bacterium]
MARVDLAVIGGGTAGLVAAIGAARQGARVTLIERARTGGDCLWSGCVPSKALIEAASAAHVARNSSHLGVSSAAVEVDLAAVMRHVTGSIEALEPHDSPQRLRAEGVEVVHGEASFADPGTVEVDGRRVRFRRALIATGSAPLVPDLPGLAQLQPLTNETVWELDELPQRLVVLGGGAIGCELGQAFARLGSQVTIVEMTDRLLVKEEPAASELIARRLRSEGVELHLGARAVRGEIDADGSRQLVVDDGNGEQHLPLDQLLVAVGRTPRTEGLGLNAAAVEVDGRGAVAVDARLRTSN